MKKYYSIFALLCASALVFAQSKTQIEPPKVKFGKVTVEDFALKNPFEADSSAHSIVLYEKGEYSYNYTERSGFVVHYKTHRRIKILDKQGFDAATKEIVYHSNYENERQELLYVEAYTFILENAIIKKIKLEKSAIFKEKISEDNYRTKFTMPNVQPGCIIDIEYETTSDYDHHLKTWYFQDTKQPVLWSILETRVPIYYNFNAVLTGYEALDYTNNTKDEQFGSFLSTVNGSRQTYTEVIYTCAMKDVPAINENTYTTNQGDYLAHIVFDLASFHPPYSFVQKQANTWQNVGAKLLDYQFFGEQITGGGFIEDDLAAALKAPKTPYAEMIGTFDFVKSHVQWNEQYSNIANETIKTIYKQKTGNSAGINLLLCAALRKRGLGAMMVLLSTRRHGKIRMSQPSFNAFNHAVVRVKIDSLTYLLDATDPLATPNCLPKTCLNGQGLLIMDKKKVEWIGTNTKERSMKQVFYDLKLDASGNLTGTSTTRFSIYEASSERKFIKSLKDEAEYKAELQKKHSGLTIKTMKLTNLDSLQKPFFGREMEIEIKNKAQVAGNMLYCPFLPFESITNNPFKSAERVTPIHFEYISAEDIVVRTAIPEGYKVEELPKNLSLTTLNGALKLVIVFQQKGNIVECVSKCSTNTMVAEPSDYLDLREWYNQVIAKHAEQIVFKKN